MSDEILTGNNESGEIRVLWPLLSNELDRNICIYTDPRHKDFVYVNIFHSIYMLCILEKYLYVMFFSMHEKFV